MLVISSTLVYAQVEITRAVTLMGSRFDITLVDQDSVSAEKNIDLAIVEIERIENLISEWRTNTLVSEINRNAGIKPIKVPIELINLTKTALSFSSMTKGAFDISIVAMDRIWKFDGSMKKMPSKDAIKNSVRNVNYKNIIINDKDSSIYLSKKGMKIGFGSIGKAYAADKAKELMIANGIKAGIINAAGDVSTWGKQIDGEPWAIGIQNPFLPDGIEDVVYMDDNAVVTSGSYEKYAEIYGKRYSHIINPKTGMPATGLVSVSVIGKDATIANGLSTSVMVLGITKGIKLLKQFPDYHYVLITDDTKVYRNK